MKNAHIKSHIRVYIKYTKYNFLPTLQKIQKNTKYELWNLYIIQNKYFFVMFPIFSEMSFSKIRKYFDIVGVFCIINRYFKYRIRILYI